MELREFKHWLLDNGLDENELYVESIKCYQVEAYRAAYIFSYLANHKYISEKIINYRGIPKSFEKNCPKTEVRLNKWEKKIKLLSGEDTWEEEINNLINADSEGKSGNIFDLPIKIRQRLPEMKNLRNVCAHAKERLITESTVQELWNDIVYMHPYFVINGTTENWLDNFEKHVKYANNESRELDVLFANFESIILEDRLKIVKQLINKYISDVEWNEEVPVIVVKFFKDKFKFESINEKILDKLTVTEQIYLSLILDDFLPQKMQYIEILEKLEDLVKDYQFRYLCDDFVNNYWKLIDKIYPHVNEDQLLKLIMTYLKNSYRLLDDIELEDVYILNQSKKLTKLILEKVSHLYYYRMTYTGNKHFDTPTFDYSRFSENFHFVKYLMYKVSTDETLKSVEAVTDFLKRCSILLKTEYRDDDYSNNSMKESVTKYNNIYKVLKEQTC